MIDLKYANYALKFDILRFIVLRSLLYEKKTLKLIKFFNREFHFQLKKKNYYYYLKVNVKKVIFS